MTPITIVDDIATSPGEVRLRVRWADDERMLNHRASIAVGGDLAALLAEISALAPDHPAVSTEDVAALADAMAECPPAPPAPEPTLEEARAAKLERLAVRRRAASQAFGPFPLTTSTEDAIAKAIKGLERSPAGATIDWEVTRGVFQSFDLSALYTLGDAAFAHVQACFANAKAITAEVLLAQSVEAVEAIDTEGGWP